MNTSNIKDTLSSIAAALGVISGAILLVGQQGVVLPSWLNTVAIVLGAVSVAIIGILTGKLPNGQTKPPDVVEQQNKAGQ